MEASRTGEPPERVRSVERSLEIRVGRLGGLELRPTRVFVWGGAAREGNERVLPLAATPSRPRLPGRPRQLHAGPVEVRALGNPLLTVTLAGVHAARRLRRGRQMPSPGGP